MSMSTIAQQHSGTTFRDGDHVVCVDDSHSFRRLTIGATYQVTIIDGHPVVISQNAAHCIERFRAIGAAT